MAKITAHGGEVGRIEYTWYRKVYCKDGTVLKDTGFGLKVSGKVKPGFDVREVYQNRVKLQKDWEREHPAGAAFRRAVQDMAGISKRWKLRTAMDLLGDDIDGIWSECCDGYGDNISASIDEVVEVCKLLEAARAEAEALAAEQDKIKVVEF